MLVGAICETLLAQLMSSRFVNRGVIYPDVKPEAWWKEAQTKNESKYLESILFPEPSELKSKSDFFDVLPLNPVALRMLVLRYPASLPRLYRQCLSLGEVESQPLAEAIFDSALPKAKKIELLKLGERSKEGEHRSTAAWFLKKLGKD